MSPHDIILHSFVNGDIVPSEQAMIPISDRAFRFGDGLFETMRVVDGQLPFLSYHLKRIERGLSLLHLPPPSWDIRKSCEQLLEASRLQNGLLRLTISAGSGGVGYQRPQIVTPSLIIESFPVRPANTKGGLSIFTSSLRVSAHAQENHFKNLQKLPMVLASYEATQHGCDGALLLDQNGYISELANANLFWRKDGIWYTPALTSAALAGTSRTVLLEQLGEKCQEGLFALEALQSADAVIATNMAYYCLAVAELKPQGWQWQSVAAAEEVHALFKDKEVKA